MWARPVVHEIETVKSQDPTAKIIISDLRFTDEYDAIKHLCPYILHIERDVEKKYNHVSEDSFLEILRFVPVEKIVKIKNEGTLQEFQNRCKDVINLLM